MATALADSNDDCPLVVVIDELDRCRPSYAVELLETAKHLFSVDGVVFVLALTRAELARSVKILYGDGFDATGYLRRFIDVDFRLPEPDREILIDRALDAVGISSYFERRKDQGSGRYDGQFVREWLQRVFSSSDLALRRVVKAIHHLGLVFATLRSESESFAMTAVLALIVKTVDRDLYYRFLRGKATDADVVDRIFSLTSELRTLQYENVGCVLESLLVLAGWEVTGDIGRAIDSPLLRKYQNQTQSESGDSAAKKHAEKLLSRFDISSDGQAHLKHSGPGAFGFKHSVDRLELLSPSLIGESVGTVFSRLPD